MANQAVVVWQAGNHFEGSAAGHTIVMDSRPPNGTDQGMGPMSLVLVALGGCTGMDIVDILAKERQELTGLRVEISGERAEDDPRVYTQIRMTYRVSGRHLARAAVERAVRLSEEKYCSVGAMLGKTAKIETVIEIEEQG
jgi:putative redox protein